MDIPAYASYQIVFLTKQELAYLSP